MHFILQNKWVWISLLVIIAIAVLGLTLLLSAPQRETYTNAWYVMR